MSEDTPPDRELPPLSAYSEENIDGAQHVPTDAVLAGSATTGFTYGIRTDSRTASSYLLTFISVNAETPKAICLASLNFTSDTVEDLWLPKKLLSNMDSIAKTVCVWNVFMIQYKLDFMEDIDTSGEES